MTHATAAEMRQKIAAGTVARPAGPEDVAGVGYLRYLDDVFGRRSSLAPGLAMVPVRDAGERRLFPIAAYNAGEGRVARAQARAAAAGGDALCGRAPLLARDDAGDVERVVGYARAGASATTLG